jgi:hypothetical protein
VCKKPDIARKEDHEDEEHPILPGVEIAGSTGSRGDVNVGRGLYSDDDDVDDDEREDDGLGRPAEVISAICRRAEGELTAREGAPAPLSESDFGVQRCLESALEAA